MARDLEQLVLVMSADVRRMEKALDRAQGKFDKTARDIERRQRELDKNLAALGRDLGQGLNRASLIAGVAFAAISAYAVKAAADAGEIENAFNVAFGEMADQARAFARTFSQEVGRSFYETQESMSRARLVLDGFGFAGEQALDVVQQIQARAVDIGSLFNVADADAFRAIISGLTGETEPMKRFGVVVNQTAVEAELLRLGFKGSAAEASEQAKVVARLNLILRGTQKAQGDAAKTADSFANQQKALRAEVRDSAVELGDRFLPVAKELLDWANDALDAFNDLPTGVQSAGLALLALTAASGPIAAAVAGLAGLIKLAREAKVALAGIGGASAAAGAGGAAGAAAGGLAAGGLAAGAVATGGVGLVVGGGAYAASRSGETRRVHGAARNPAAAELEDLVRARKALETVLARNAANASAPLAGFGTRVVAEEKLAAVIAEISKRGAATPAKAPGGAADPAGGFALTPDQLRPAKPSKGEKTATDKALREAERLAAQALAQEERTAALLGRADEDLLRARTELVAGAEARLAAELDLLDLERQGRARELEFAVQQGDLTKTQAKAVAEVEEQARLQREANAHARAGEAIAAERLALYQAELDGQAEAAWLSASLARTAGERRAAEMRLLELAERRERAELEAVMASELAAPAAKAEAQRRLATLQASGAARREEVRRGTMSPLEAYADSAIKTVGELNEATQAWVAGGLADLEKGLAEAALRAGDLGETARNVFRQMAADFLAAMVRKNITGPLAALAGTKLPGFARGTNFAPGGLAIVGEEGPEVVNLPRGAKVTPNHKLRLAEALPRQTVLQQFITVDNRGAVIWESEAARLMAYADQAAARAGVAGAQAGRHMARNDLSRRQMRGLG